MWHPALREEKPLRKIALGWHAMGKAESHKTVFDIMISRFKKMPRVIVYDNACHLLEYFLNRYNHVGCSNGFNISMFDHLKWANSQAAEQGNSALKKIK
eukprot:g42912.t1